MAAGFAAAATAATAVEGSISSSTSHTLTFGGSTTTNNAHIMALTTTAPHEAASMLAFLDALKPERRHTFLQPSPSVATASLHWAKHALDAFAGQVGDEQAARKARDKKRKREGGAGGRGDVLKIRKVHVEGLETAQVWQQARRVIQSTLQASKELLQELEEDGELLKEGEEEEDDEHEEVSSGDAKRVRFEQDGSQIGSGIEEADLDSASGEEDFHDAESGQDEEDLSGEEDEDDMEDLGDEDDFEDEQADEDDELNQPTETYAEDPNGLNDGFFSIDDFNKQTQYFEDQDYKADPNTDVASDDDEVDWHGDPFAEPKGKSKGAKAKDDDEEDAMSNPEDDDDDEDAGPTFGDMDLDAPEGASDDEGNLADGLEGDMGMDLTADDIFYKDFFAPPAKKGNRGDNERKWKLRKQEKPDQQTLETAMADVRRDLFDDESDQSDDEDALSDVSAGNPKSRRSAHERRQAKLGEEIRKMESELVAKRAWTLSGEASASMRPQNSLLEHDLDFEHAGKPIPVVTEATSEDIEDLVKRRILAGEFDTLVKRRPDANVPADVRRGMIELDDAKGKQSLAEIYEEEHVKNSNPDAYVSAKDEKLHKEEKEVENMWKDVAARLDALSSWHYKPKPAAPSLTVVSDVATVAMEDAQPTTAQGVSGGDNMLAPQEVYKAGQDNADKGELVAKSGLPVARQEMTREDKVRRRRREKERIRKAGGETTKLSKKTQDKKETLAELKRGGVKVINKKGEVLDMEGKKPQAGNTATSNSLKL